MSENMFWTAFWGLIATVIMTLIISVTTYSIKELEVCKETGRCYVQSHREPGHYVQVDVE